MRLSSFSMTALLFALVALCMISLSASTSVSSFFMPTPPIQPRTLVLYDDVSIQATHSAIFETLRSYNHVLTFAHATDETIRLSRYGVYSYDNIILFCPAAEDFGDFTGIKDIVDFVDSGHNALVTFSGNVSEPMRLLAYELGIEVGDEKTAIVDHHHFDALAATRSPTRDAARHSVIASAQWINQTALTGPIPAAPFLFQGVSHSSPFYAPPSPSAKLFIPVLTAEPTAYVPASASTQTSEIPYLLSVYQTRTNARVLFSGSLYAFSNEALSAPISVGGVDYTRSANAETLSALVTWTFHERGWLRAHSLRHHQVARLDDVNPHSYRVSDNIAFSIHIDEWNGHSKEWAPFNGTDVQLELTMLDPAIRQTLRGLHGIYTLNLTVPDVYGVYKFVVRYDRVGYNVLDVQHQVSITPYRHDQYERFLGAAYPYYATGFATMIAFFLFGIVFLYQKESR